MPNFKSKKQISILVVAIAIIVSFFIIRDFDFSLQRSDKNSTDEINPKENAQREYSIPECQSDDFKKYLSETERNFVLDKIKDKEKISEYTKQGYTLQYICESNQKLLLFFDFEKGFFDKALLGIPIRGEINNLPQKTAVAVFDLDFQDTQTYPAEIYNYRFEGTGAIRCFFDKYLENKILYICNDGSDGKNTGTWYVFDTEKKENIKVREEYFYRNYSNPPRPTQVFKFYYRPDLLELFSKKSFLFKDGQQIITVPETSIKIVMPENYYKNELEKVFFEKKNYFLSKINFVFDDDASINENGYYPIIASIVITKENSLIEKQEETFQKQEDYENFKFEKIGNVDYYVDKRPRAASVCTASPMYTAFVDNVKIDISLSFSCQKEIPWEELNKLVSQIKIISNKFDYINKDKNISLKFFTDYEDYMDNTGALRVKFGPERSCELAILPKENLSNRIEKLKNKNPIYLPRLLKINDFDVIKYVDITNDGPWIAYEIIGSNYIYQLSSNSYIIDYIPSLIDHISLEHYFTDIIETIGLLDD